MAFDDRVVFGISVFRHCFSSEPAPLSHSVMCLPRASPVQQEHSSDGFHVSQMAAIQNSL